MSKKQKKLVAFTAALAISFGIVPAANAMHIMEGYLPPVYCIVWGIICIPFLVAGFFSIRNTLSANRRSLTILAMAGAFIFVISSLKIPALEQFYSDRPQSVSWELSFCCSRQFFWHTGDLRHSAPTHSLWQSRDRFFPMESISCA